MTATRPRAKRSHSPRVLREVDFRPTRGLAAAGIPVLLIPTEDGRLILLVDETISVASLCEALNPILAYFLGGEDR